MSHQLQTCDFCDQVIDAGTGTDADTDTDNELHPVFVGSPPEPGHTTEWETAASDDRILSRHINTDGPDWGRDTQVLKYSFGHLKALIEALHSHDNIEINHKESVLVPDEAMMSSLGNKQDASFSGLNMDVNRDKVGVRVDVRPGNPNLDPDLFVCDICKDELKSL